MPSDQTAWSCVRPGSHSGEERSAGDDAVTRDHYFFIALSAVVPLVGWGTVYLASRIERQRQQRHAERFHEPRQPPLPEWTAIMRGWRPPKRRQ